MKKYVLAAIPAALALTACSQGTETAGQETSAPASDDNDAADPGDDAAKPAPKSMATIIPTKAQMPITSIDPLKDRPI